jgi:pescadillo protein
LGRDEADDAARLERNKSRMTLDHLVKERYPTFIDALRDMDDALSMLFLFASLPSTSHVPPKTIALCQRLCLEFQHYLIVSRSLRKSFLSIKGVYYQATIQGQDIMWLVPYKFVQKMAGDIDFRIMGTFIEFYTTLLGFVNYRLYTTIGLVYPPKFNAASDEQGGELGAYTLEGKTTASNSLPAAITNGPTKDAEAPVNAQLASAAQAKADQLAQQPTVEDDIESKSLPTAQDGVIDTFQSVAEGGDSLLQPQYTDPQVFDLFSSSVFFLSRETPKASLEFILRAFGCQKVGWHSVLGDGAFTTDEKDPRITHQVVDRPPFVPGPTESDDDDEEPSDPNPPQALRIAGRTYVQPQWIWDCINQGRILRPDIYSPGQELPPHLSPWAKPKSGAYDPTAPLAEQEKEGEAELDAAEAEEDEPINGAAQLESDDSSPASSVASESDAEDVVLPGEGMDIDNSDEEDEEEEKEDVAENGEWDGLSEESDASEVSDDEYQRGLQAEASGKTFSIEPKKTKGEELRKKKAIKEKQEQEELDRQRMMLPNKKRKLFDKMQYGNKKRDAEAEKLRKKRRRIEREKANGST